MLVAGGSDSKQSTITYLMPKGQSRLSQGVIATRGLASDLFLVTCIVHTCRIVRIR